MTNDALWAVVPVKPLGEGKSRLAPLLSRDERAVLSEGLLRRTLAALTQSTRIAGLIVVSRDPAVWKIAATMGVVALAESGNGLNGALEQARTAAIGWGADAVMVLPADLPGVTAEEVDEAVAQAGAGHGILIVPSVTGGTNLLLVRPANAIPFSFGVESCARHAALARARGLEVRMFSSPILALDVDLPGDVDPALLAAYELQGPATRLNAAYREQTNQAEGASVSLRPESRYNTDFHRSTG